MSTSEYRKGWKSFPEQLGLLKLRGMQIPDEKSALNYLEKIGYYRLSGYFHSFRTNAAQGSEPGAGKDDDYYPETSFTDVVKLYEFDKKLRSLVLEALESIEVKLRVDITYLLGRHDLFAHTKKSAFWHGFTRLDGPRTGKSQFAELQDKHLRQLESSSEDFVKHYRKKHGDKMPFPIWIACEVWDFGTTARIFQGIQPSYQKEISVKYGVEKTGVFRSWLRVLNDLRNNAAHFCRLWNRDIPSDAQPELPGPGEISWCDGFLGGKELMRKTFLLLSITRHLVKVIDRDDDWPGKMKQHLLNFPKFDSCGTVSRYDMGVVSDWQNWW